MNLGHLDDQHDHAADYQYDGIRDAQTDDMQTSLQLILISDASANGRFTIDFCL